MTGTANTAEGDKILIVDDDPGLSSLLERFFTSKGYRARAVPNTEQMDRLLQREVFNLVVLDLMLPGEDGLSACKRLRQQNNQIPIIMLTAKGDELSRIKGLELGADDYLGKPFNPDELMARVKAVLRRQAPPCRVPRAVRTNPSPSATTSCRWPPANSSVAMKCTCSPPASSPCSRPW